MNEDLPLATDEANEATKQTMNKMRYLVNELDESNLERIVWIQSSNFRTIDNPGRVKRRIEI